MRTTTKRVAIIKSNGVLNMVELDQAKQQLMSYKEKIFEMGVSL